ncbi:MAG: 1-(5-phosphoribosyl)-5-[(5-phosphoribosylamino)methylideneamino]imidazole-4-carboxamide isomerase [Pseudomonadota bacterium]
MLYPAIDIIDGQCVRLHKGDFDQKTEYKLSPLAVAKNYEEQGAEWLHMVDLDGARNPQKRQISLIKEIVQSTGLKVQTGGGIRTKDDVQVLIEAGVQRIVIGSLSVKDSELTKDIFATFGGDKICLAADIIPRDGENYIAVSGWQEQSDVTLNNFLNDYLQEGLRHILCTDIDRDGTMQGANKELYKKICQDFSSLKIQASGGVNSLEDLKILNTDGVIVGKALYEGVFTVKQALDVIGGVRC